MTDVNPFQFGALALDEAFTDREAEIAELRADVRNGQDVVVFAPRRYGKSSLVWRAIQELARDRVLVASVDLMTTPTPAKLAEKLARAIHDDIASPLLRARERLRIFGDLKVTPTITIDPESGAPAFSFSVTERPEDIHATLERLLELPAQLATDRKRQVALVLDEFQEVVDIDPKLPRLMRAVFQLQPEVGHVYLGSKRHMMRRIFSDENEPFWRSAKQMELGVIEPAKFAPFIEKQFERSGRFISEEAVAAVLESTHGHPYATQELCYFTWQEVGPEERAEAAERRGRAGEGAALRARPFLAAVGARLGRAAAAAGRAGARAGAAAVGRLPAAPQPPWAVDRAARGRVARARGAGRARSRAGADRRAVPRRLAAA